MRPSFSLVERFSSSLAWMALRILSARISRAFEIGLGQDRRELFAAVTGREVLALDVGFQRHRDEAQHLVAGLVAPGVVEVLEVVDVEEHQAERRVAGAGLGEGLAAGPSSKLLAVEDLGQRIEHGSRGALRRGRAAAPRCPRARPRASARARGWPPACAAFRRSAAAPWRAAAASLMSCVEVAGRGLQGAGIGVGRRHRGVDGVVHGFDAAAPCAR